MYPLMLLNIVKGDSQITKLGESNPDKEMIESGFLGLFNALANNDALSCDSITVDSPIVSKLKTQMIDILQMLSCGDLEIGGEVQQEATSFLQQLQTDTTLTDQDIIGQATDLLKKAGIIPEDIMFKSVAFEGTTSEDITYESIMLKGSTQDVDKHGITNAQQKDNVFQQEAKSQNSEEYQDGSYGVITKTEMEQIQNHIKQFLSEQSSKETVSFDQGSQPMIVTNEASQEKVFAGKAVVENSTQQQIETNKYDIISQLVEKASAGVKEGKYEMQVTLKPEYLGKVSIEMVMEDQGMVVKILAPNHSVENAISSQMMHLEQDLKAQGIEVLKMEVTQQPMQDSSQLPNQSQESYKQSKQKYFTTGDIDTLEELSDMLSMTEQLALFSNSVEFRA